MTKENEFKFVNVKDLKLEDVEKALEAGQGRARVRTLDTQEVINYLKKMIESLNSLVPKTYQSGVKVSYIEGAERYPKAYKFIPEGTAIKMLKRGKTYYVTIERENCNFNHAEKYIINAYKNSGLSMFDFREAMGDLLDNEFNQAGCFEYSKQIESRKFEKCKVICYENGTFTLEILEQLIDGGFKSRFVDIDSFKALLQEIGSDELLVSDVKNKDFLTFKQPKEIINFWDMKKL